MNDSDYWTVQAMKTYGGGFVQALAVTIERADDENLARIKRTWPEYWAMYEELGAKLAAKDAEART